MTPLTNLAGDLRRWLLVPLLVTLATSAHAASVYLSPGGTGSRSGIDANNTKPASVLQTEIAKMQPGDTIWLTAGTYTNARLSIVGSGTALAPKTIRGLADSSGNLPRFEGTYNFAQSAQATDYLFKFVNYNDAETSHWVIRDFEVENHGFVFDMPLVGTSFTLRQNILFENIAMARIEDAIRIRNASNITVRSCAAESYCKKAFRIGNYSRFITFEDCLADALLDNTGNPYAIPTRAIPVGFGSDAPPHDSGAIHDLRFIRCEARNNRYGPQGSSNYWNGDGFSTERGVYNVTYSHCIGVGNHDGGWDDKAVNVIYENCIALRNKRGFRSWSNVTLMNCLSVFNVKWGGSSSAAGSWIGSDTGTGAIYRSTFHNNESAQVREENGLPVGVTVYDSLLSIDSTAPSGALAITAGNVTLSGSILFAPGGSALDPLYVSPANGWEKNPADAFNSLQYPTLGYQGPVTATTLPAAPSTAVATLNASQASLIDLSWTDNSTNETRFRIDRSTNGGVYTTIGYTGLNANRYMDSGLAPGTSYTYRIYANNNLGDSTTYASVTRATASLAAPAAPTNLTVTAGLADLDEITLRWDDSANNESGFEIQRSYDNTNYVTIATLPANAVPVLAAPAPRSGQYTDTEAPHSTLLYYRVRAVNAAGGANSTAQSVTLPWYQVIDNADTASVVMTPTTPTNPWVVSTQQTDRWGANYLANTTPATPATFRFIPNIPITGTYELYMFWAPGSNRATNMPVDIIHAGGTATTSVNQQSGGAWRPLGAGSYTFNAGTTGSVLIRNTGVNGAVIADAICVRTNLGGGPNAPISVTATAASGTTVNVSWSDQSANETSFVIERASETGAFAQIGSAAANATSYVDTTAVAGATYRYRLRAKLNALFGRPSAVATTFTPLVTILDDAPSAEVTHSPATWTASSIAGGSYLGSYSSDDNTGLTAAKSMLFRPASLPAGTYQIHARWTSGTNRSKNVRFLLNGAYGKLPVIVNQEYNNNTWMLLGTIRFTSSGSVELTNEGAEEFVIGDAVRFTRVAN